MYVVEKCVRGRSRELCCMCRTWSTGRGLKVEDETLSWGLERVVAMARHMLDAEGLLVVVQGGKILRKVVEVCDLGLHMCRFRDT